MELDQSSSPRHEAMQPEGWEQHRGSGGGPEGTAHRPTGPPASPHCLSSLVLVANSWPFLAWSFLLCCLDPACVDQVMVPKLVGTHLLVSRGDVGRVGENRGKKKSRVLWSEANIPQPATCSASSEHGPGWEKHAVVSWPTGQPGLGAWAGTIWRGRMPTLPTYLRPQRGTRWMRDLQWRGLEQGANNGLQE